MKNILKKLTTGKGSSKVTSLVSFDRRKSSAPYFSAHKKNVPVSMAKKMVSTVKKNSVENEKHPYLPENSIIVWLDATVDKNTEANKKSLELFFRANDSLQTFSDLEQCVHFIDSVKSEKIFIVASGSLGQQITPRVHNLDQVHSIYIFCGNKANHEQWVKEFKKIRSVHTKIKELSDTIKRDIRQYDNGLTPISILPPSSASDINESNKEFIYLHMMKCIILEISYDKKFRQELVAFSRKFYMNNPAQLNLIDTLDENYNNHAPIWWYTRRCFLYSMLRKAFYHQDFELIYKLAFFIRDLHRNIKKIYLQVHNHQFEPIVVYRATCMDNSQREYIEQNQGGLLSFNDFLLTTLERSLAVKYATAPRQSSDSVGVIFKISINPIVSSIPYVALNNESFLSNSHDEILFSMDTIFRIESVEKLSDRLFQINLNPASKKDEDIKNLSTFLGDISEGSWGWYRLAKLLIDVDAYEQVADIYKHIYSQTHQNQRDERAFLQHELGYLSECTGNIPISITHYKQALEIYATYLSPTHPTLLTTYVNLALVLEKQGNLAGALEQYQHALHIDKTDEPNDVIQHVNIGRILQKQGNYNDAQHTYEKAIQILMKEYPSAYPILADTYFSMADMFYSIKDYSKALSYYEKELSVEEKSLPNNHPSIAITHYNMAAAYEALRDYKKAIDSVQCAVEISTSFYGKDHAETKEIIAYLEELQALSVGSVKL